MKSILVTGANGFVGSHTLGYLSQQPDIQLIAACRDKNKLPSSFSGEVREGDIRDDSYLSNLLDDIDVLVNAMAWTSLWGHGNKSDELFYKPTIKLINKYQESSANSFINVSTTSAAAPDHSTNPMSEGIPRGFWPHLNNVIMIENALRELSSQNKKVVNLRLGIFAGNNYALGILPILLPRLKTHLVPWVNGGKTHLPITDGRDIGQAMSLAALKDDLQNYEAFNIVGPTIPTMREVIMFLHTECGYPKPHFSVPFTIAYPFAWLMEKIDPIMPWEPLITRSIVHLLEDTNVDNNKATELLGYQPQYDWRNAIRLQVSEMKQHQTKAMSMTRPMT